MAYRHCIDAHFRDNFIDYGQSFLRQNEKNQIMKSNVWLRLVWNDYQLQWDESEYGGIGVLRLPPDKVSDFCFSLFSQFLCFIA